MTVRSLAANDDVYDLSIANFTKRDTFTVRRIERTATTLDITYDITHPFAAPTNLAGPATAANRADLGIAGRVLFLLDVPTPAGNTYLSDVAPVVANTGTIADADGYFQPAGLLPGLNLIADTFPYLTLVNEAGADGTRVGISNGGVPTGNYNAGIGGWQQANIGPANDAWTGYGVLHQGQSSRRILSLNLNALTGPVSLESVILAKYNDPRQGINASQKRANRLPKNPPDPSQFAYRMPHGALDVEQVTFYGETGSGFLANTISSSTLNFGVVDWDARSAETSESDLALDPIVTSVAVGERGVPDLFVNIPAIQGGTSVQFDPGTDLQDDDSAFGGDPGLDLGEPGDALYYTRTLTNSQTSGQTAGTVTGMVWVRDVETASVSAGWRFALAPDLTPATNPPANAAFQAFTVTLAPASTPPTGNYVVTTPNVVTGNSCSISVNSLVDVESDPLDILVDWDNDGTYTFATTVNAPYPASVPLTSPITYTWVGPDPDTRSVPVRISDGFSEVQLTPTKTFVVLSSAPVCGAAFAGTNRGAWGTTAVYTSWATLYGATTTYAGNDFGAFHSATLNEFVVQRYANTQTIWDFYRLTPTATITATRISNFGAFFSGRLAHQIETDSTNRVLVATRGANSSDGDPNEIYGTSATSQAQTNIYWFDYDGSTEATTINTINTTERVVALTVDQSDNLYYIDVQSILHKLVKTSNYAEDFTSPFPIDLKAAPYNIGPTATWRVNDFGINFHNQAFFILATNTSSAVDPRITRIECDGTMYTSTNSTNPVTFVGYYTNGGHDIYIDQWTTGGTLTPEADVQMVIANAVLTAGTDGPGFRIFISDLVNTATWDIAGTDSFGKIAIVNDVLLGKDDYYGPSAIGMNFTPPSGWQ
ncbi:MAG: hypothetical protein GEEBNDBF_02532 [bacterium]|nr:hypothetical protein [bacterium]